MPRTAGQACLFVPGHDDLARHDFAGGAAPILDLIAEHYAGDPAVDPDAIAAARAKSVSMLQRAAEIELQQQCGSLHVRVINQTGHKLPTGHIEGRRVWINVRFFDGGGQLLREHGHYDPVEAHLDADTTDVYEMHVGLSETAAKITGYPAGVTTHMALADIIAKDNRIPPRGFDNQTYADAGAPVVGATYANGQHWDDSYFSIPDGTTLARVAVYYQNLPRHYIEALRDGNVTDDWGDTLYDLWETTGKGEPIVMDQARLRLPTFIRGDLDCDGDTGIADLLKLFMAWGHRDVPEDLNGDRIVDVLDFLVLLGNWSPG